MSFCSSGHWCQVNIALVHAIINSSIPSTSFTPTCANTIPAYIAAHLDNVHSLGEHKFLADAKDWNAFCAFLQGLEQQTGTKFTVDVHSTKVNLGQASSSPSFKPPAKRRQKGDPINGSKPNVSLYAYSMELVRNHPKFKSLPPDQRQLTDAWFKARLGYITASQVPKLLGFSRKSS